MGLFDKRDKKKRDDFDSPVEQIDLSAAPAPAPKPPAPAQPPPPSPAPTAAPAPVAKQAEPAPRAAPAAAAARPTSPDADDYGIEKAIELMRTLPSENVELVVQVVKFSLESVGIKLPTIIEDAIRRQKDIQGRIGVLKSEIADLEAEIKQRKEEIDRLEADHKETTMVRDRLELAENLGSAKPTMPGAAPSASPGMSGSGGIPRVTKQTTPPPLSTPPSPLSSSQSGPVPSPSPQPGGATPPVKK